MNTTAKPKSAHVTQQFRDVTDASAERSKEVFETIGAATTEAAEVMTTCCSTALKGMQDYNSKVLEFARANTASYVEFVQKLATSSRPRNSSKFQLSMGAISLRQWPSRPSNSRNSLRR